MYTASLSYSMPPTSAIGAYRSFSLSLSPFFLTVSGSGQGSGSTCITSASTLSTQIRSEGCTLPSNPSSTSSSWLGIQQHGFDHIAFASVNGYLWCRHCQLGPPKTSRNGAGSTRQIVTSLNGAEDAPQLDGDGTVSLFIPSVVPPYQRGRARWRDGTYASRKWRGGHGGKPEPSFAP
jgi:hypothetical protein